MGDPGRVSILSFIKDLPNICSLFGLLCAVVGIYFAIEGFFPAAMISMLWAVLFDWFDGIIARKMKGRTKGKGAFGGQLDSLIDIVSFGVLPGVVLLSFGNYDAWFLPGAFIIIAANAIRLSYFNVYGLIDSKSYTGLSVDNNGIILPFAFLFESFFSHTAFSIILYTLVLCLAALHLASIPIPKPGAKWVYALVVYVLIVTTFFGWTIWKNVV